MDGRCQTATSVNCSSQLERLGESFDWQECGLHRVAGGGAHSRADMSGSAELQVSYQLQVPFVEVAIS